MATQVDVAGAYREILRKEEMKLKRQQAACEETERGVIALRETIATLEKGGK